jgi:hypothetical protein
MSRMAIFQNLCIISRDIIHFILFVCAFYAFEFLLFYIHCNHEGDVMVIPSAMGTHQGDFLGGALFALVHFRTLCLQLTIFFLVYFHPLQMTFTS